MCGIAGCLALAAEAGPDESWVHTATERITHRGPDDEGYFSDPDVALGYKRLAIIDLSPGGHQPMRSADGRYWMVYNGEIYNYVELGEELRQQGVDLRTSSDSEVLLETYARVGKDVVHRLRGMFAFAIWDTWTRELFCARDQFGIKPFYYRIDRAPADPRGPGGGRGWQGAPASPPASGAGPDWDAPSGDGRGWSTPPAAVPPGLRGPGPGPAGPFPGGGFGQDTAEPGGRHGARGAVPPGDKEGRWPQDDNWPAPAGGRHAGAGADPGRAQRPSDGVRGDGPSWDETPAPRTAAGAPWEPGPAPGGALWERDQPGGGQPGGGARWDEPRPRSGPGGAWDEPRPGAGPDWDGSGDPPAGRRAAWDEPTAGRRAGAPRWDGPPADGRSGGGARWDEPPAGWRPGGAPWDEAPADGRPGGAPWDEAPADGRPGGAAWDEEIGERRPGGAPWDVAGREVGRREADPPWDDGTRRATGRGGAPWDRDSEDPWSSGDPRLGGDSWAGGDSRMGGDARGGPGRAGAGPVWEPAGREVGHRAGGASWDGPGRDADARWDRQGDPLALPGSPWEEVSHEVSRETGGRDEWETPARPGSSASWEAGAGQPQWQDPRSEPAAVPMPGGDVGAGPMPGSAQAGAGAFPAELRLRFGSERKSLAEPGELPDLDVAALRRYLSFQYVPPPDTLTPPIKVLPPGHAMIARPGGSVDVYRYWRPELRPAKVGSETSARAILAALRDSIAVHLRSDAPLGAFLSGGIDSAAICALAAEHRPDLRTFTVGFEREGYSEIDRAQETAAALGVRSYPYVISPEEFFHYLPQIVWHLDDPMADAAAVPLWFVAREAAKQVKVVLSGEGSDELFGGYAIYHQPGVVRAGERLPDWGRVPLRRAASLIPSGVKGKGLLERTSTPLRRRYIGNAHVFVGEQVDFVTRPGAAGPFDVTDRVYDQAERAGLDDVATMQLVDINTWLPGDILVKADRMTMAHSLELRVPFLDREVMGVAARLARDEKIGAGTTKLALRAAMSEILPRAAAERAKLGFPVPIGHWLKGEAYGFAQHLFREAQTEEWIDRDAALGLLERFRSGEADVSWRHLWVLIVFSLWHQIYVERVYDPVALGWEAAQGVAR